MPLSGAPSHPSEPLARASVGPAAEGSLPNGDRPFGWPRRAYALLTVAYAGFQTLISSIDTAPALDVLGREGFLRQAGQTASNFAHVPLFAGFAALAFFAVAPNGRRDLARPRGAVVTLLVALAFGLVDEGHQAFVPGRFPSLLDVGSDVVGAALALAALGAFGRHRVAVMIPLALAGLFLSAVAAVGNDPGVVPFRRLADRLHGYPEREYVASLDDVRAWRRNVPEPTLVVESVGRADGTHELRLTLPPSPWPGVVTRSMPFDWSGYSHLEIAIRNDAGSPLRFGVRVDDLADRRHEEHRDLPQGETAFRFPLVPFSANVDMTKVDTLLVFLAGNDATTSLAITSLRLSK